MSRRMHYRQRIAGAHGNRPSREMLFADPATEKTTPLTVGKLMTEPEAVALFEKIVWPNGPRCPKCKAEGYGLSYDLGRRRSGLRVCKCRHQFSIRCGTALEASPLPIKTWIKAIAVLAAIGNDGRECEFVRAFPDVSYKTAHLMRKRLLADEKLLKRFRRVQGLEKVSAKNKKGADGVL